MAEPQASNTTMLDEMVWPKLHIAGEAALSKSEISTAPSTPHGGQGKLPFDVSVQLHEVAQKLAIDIASLEDVQEVVDIDTEGDMSARRIEDLFKTLSAIIQGPQDSQSLEKVCRELRQMSREDPKHHRDLIGQVGVIEALVVTVNANAASGEVQMLNGVLSTLENITVGHTKNCKLFLECHGVETVLQAMQYRMEAAEVQHIGCKVLLNSAMCSQSSQEQVVALGGTEAVVAAMGVHISSALVQEVGCRALKEFAAFSSFNQEKIASIGGLPAVLRAMETHMASSRVQEFACGVLRNMCSSNAEYQDCLAARGGIELVLRAMKSHAQAAAVQWAGCWALFCLGVHNREVQKEVVTHGGVEAVTQAMDEHRSNHKVQEPACWALRDLIEHAAIVNEASFTSSVSQSVMRAMEKHPKNAKVQEAAKAALKKLAANESTKGWVKTSILGRCGRMGRSTTMRALSAIQENDEEEE